MLVKESLKGVLKIEIIFAQALVEDDEQTLLDVLSDEGKFTIQDENFDTPVVDKLTFIDWILKQKKDTLSLTYYFDQCTFCKIGNPVGIFNDGSFPKKQKDYSEKIKTGLMFISNNNMIEEIDFCYSFITTENESGFEHECEKKIQEYMSKKRTTREQAIKQMGEDRDKLFNPDLSDIDDLTRKILNKVYPDMKL